MVLQVDKTRAMMEKLCKYIHAKDNSDRLRTRAMLCHIYHHALHNRWFDARDLMLMSHLQDTIQHSDIPTQVCFKLLLEKRYFFIVCIDSVSACLQPLIWSLGLVIKIFSCEMTYSFQCFGLMEAFIFSLQILYNRTMVQLGLCAFREGMIRDAHNALVDIQSGGRAKELLAQVFIPAIVEYLKYRSFHHCKLL